MICNGMIKDVYGSRGRSQVSSDFASRSGLRPGHTFHARGRSQASSAAREDARPPMREADFVRAIPPMFVSRCGYCHDTVNLVK